MQKFVIIISYKRTKEKTMRLITLSSGSKGNAILVEGKNTKILVDAGISALQIEKRLELVGVQPSEIDAILVTHEHIDHIKGIAVFAKRHKTKVYAHSKVWTMLDCFLTNLPKQQKISFEDYTFFISELEILPFEVMHDAVHTNGFSIMSNGRKISIVTDLGRVTKSVLESLSQSDLVVIESNHDEEMLMCGPYTASLKRRINSSKGHLSNTECAKAIAELVKLGTKNFVLAHISEKNNTEELAKLTCYEVLENSELTAGVHISIAYQDRVGTNYILKNKNTGEL